MGKGKRRWWIKIGFRKSKNKKLHMARSAPALLMLKLDGLILRFS